MKNSVNNESLRRANDMRVLSLLRSGAKTRRELQSVTSLSWGGITNAVNRLTAAGYIVEIRSEKQCAAGRTPSAIALRDDDNLIIALDVNRTGLSGCLMSLSGCIVCESVAEADYSSKEALLECIYGAIKKLTDMRPGARFMAAGISMQGEVDVEKGVSAKLYDVPGWSDVPLCSIISGRFGIPAYIAHDPDCMLHAYIADTGLSDGILLRLDTDIGMAVCISGKMLTGCGLLEIGHTKTAADGPECRCGMRGCLAAYLATGDHAEAARQLALTLHNLIQLFRPAAIVLTGRLLLDDSGFSDMIRRELAAVSMHGTIAIDTLSDTRGAMRGAGLIAADRLLTELDILKTDQTGGDEHEGNSN